MYKSLRLVFDTYSVHVDVHMRTSTFVYLEFSSRHSVESLDESFRLIIPESRASGAKPKPKSTRVHLLASCMLRERDQESAFDT